MPRDLIDANVILRHLTGDHEEHSPRASAFMAAVEVGDRSAHLPDLVVAEVVWTLAGLYKLPRSDIRDALVQIVQLRGLSLDDKGRLIQALNLYADLSVSFVDAYLASKALAEGANSIVSFDRDFDRIPGISRVEP